MRSGIAAASLESSRGDPQYVALRSLAVHHLVVGTIEACACPQQMSVRRPRWGKSAGSGGAWVEICRARAHQCAAQHVSDRCPAVLVVESG